MLAMLNEGADGMEELDRAQLLRFAKAGKVTVLDLRPEDEYAAGHLPHALSVPMEQLESRLKTLPRDQQIVAYCRGPYCVLANEAVRILRAKGFQAAHLHDGVAEWSAAGFPLSTD